MLLNSHDKFCNISTEFKFDNEQLKAEWNHFHRGTLAPYPTTEDMENISAVATRLFDNHRAVRPDELASGLQEAWRAVFEGRFADAKDIGFDLGPVGYVPAFFGQVYFAMRLATPQVRKEMLTDIVGFADMLKHIRGKDPLANFGVAMAMALITREAPLRETLKLGYVPKMISLLDDCLRNWPTQSYALTAMGGIHGGMIARVGKLTAKLSYGATLSKFESYFQEGFAVNSDIAIAHIEYAELSHQLHGKRAAKKVAHHIEKARTIEPTNAIEYLDQLHAVQLETEFKR